MRECTHVVVIVAMLIHSKHGGNATPKEAISELRIGTSFYQDYLNESLAYVWMYFHHSSHTSASWDRTYIG